MWKFVLIVFLISVSILTTSAFALEVEIQKESDRILESKGWSTPNKFPLQEQLQIIIDKTNKKNIISIGLLSTSPNDIRFPEHLESISSNPKIHSFTLTNKFACAPTKIDNGCIIIEIEREGLGNNIQEIQKNAKEIADKIVSRGVILSIPEFYSAGVEPKYDAYTGEKIMIAKVVYTVNKQSTNSLFGALAPMLISSDIRTSGGFYDIGKSISSHHFSELKISLIPLDDNMLRTIHISLMCSNTLRELPDCGIEDIDEQIGRGDISPLSFIQEQNIHRSEIFADEFLPLNSIIHVLIYHDNDMEVRSVNDNIIKKFSNIGDIQESGWFFASKDGKKIDGKYIFGSESSVSKDSLLFSIGEYSGRNIEINETDGGGCLIATAAFGSEMAPQVQFLREIRDNTVLQTQSGSLFMTGFNQFYYSFSPAIADYERENPAFKEVVKLSLTPLLTSLTLLQYVDIDSESEMLGYGIGVILLNIGMYFVAPAILIMKIKKLI